MKVLLPLTEETQAGFFLVSLGKFEVEIKENKNRGAYHACAGDGRNRVSGEKFGAPVAGTGRRGDHSYRRGRQSGSEPPEEIRREVRFLKGDVGAGFTDRLHPGDGVGV